MKDKIVLISGFDSRQPGERTVALINASKFSKSKRLLGGGSACGKDSADTAE